MKLTKNKNIRSVLLSTLLTVLFTVPASANNPANKLLSSALGSGIVNMINDISYLLIFICPLAGAAAAGYYFIRRGMSDEQDGKMWEKRIKTAIICGVGGCLTSAIITVVSSYFQV